jgi:hypothetical protein
MNSSPDRQPTDTDDELLELLSRALQASDPVPPHVVAAARGAWAWRNIDEELADLVFDSAMELTGTRDRDAARQLTFRAPGVEIEVMVIDTAVRRLVGQLVPAKATTVRLDGTDQQLAATADRFGRFTFDDVHPGPIRITVIGAHPATDITTDWVLL